MNKESGDAKKCARKPLSFADRKKIQELLAAHHIIKEIGVQLGKSTNCINLELRRSGGRTGYDAERAQRLADERWQKNKTWSNENWNPVKLDQFMQMIARGGSPGAIRKDLGMSYLTMVKLYKRQGLKIPTVFDLINEALDKIYAMEEQIKILFEIMEK